MGKQAAAEMPEVEAPSKKSKKEKALLDTVAEDIVVEEETEEEKRKRKEEKRKRKQAAAAEAEGEAEATPEAAVEEDADEEANEEKRKRKEEKRKRKQAEAEAASGDVPEKEVKEKSDKAETKNAGKDNSALQVFVGSLPFKADEATVRQHFGECGDIVSFLMPLNDRQKPRGIALITYKTQDGLDKALLRNGLEFQGRPLKVNKPDADKTLKVNGTLPSVEVKQHKPEKKNDKAEAEAADEEEEPPKKKAKKDAAAEAADEEKVKTDAQAPKKQGKRQTDAQARQEASNGDSLTVFVGDLPFRCTEMALRKVFSKCGEIQSLKVPGKKKGRGIAFITYTCKEDVGKALQLNASRVNLDGERRIVKVNRSDSVPVTEEKRKSDKAEKKKSDNAETNAGKVNSEWKIFVGSLPFSADEATVRQHFGECGDIVSFLMPLNDRQKPRGIALITYKTQEGLDKALLRNGLEFQGRPLKVNKPDVEKTLKVNGTVPEMEVKQHKPEKKKDKGEGNSKGDGQGSAELRLFVGGLPFECDEDTLREAFGQCGEIAALKKIVPSKPEKKPRGIAYITYKTQKGYDKALAFDGTEYEGCTLRVNQAGAGQGSGKDDEHKGKSKGGKGEGKDSKGKGKDGKAKGKVAKGKGKDDKGGGKDGKGKGKESKSSKGKGKGKKGKKGESTSEDMAAAKSLFDNSDEL